MSEVTSNEEETETFTDSFQAEEKKISVGIEMEERCIVLRNLILDRLMLNMEWKDSFLEAIQTFPNSAGMAFDCEKQVVELYFQDAARHLTFILFFHSLNTGN